MGSRVIVVAETDRLNRMASKAVEKLGRQLRSGRAVKAEAKRFAEKVAGNPSPITVQVFDVVGFCNPHRARPGVVEPIVLLEGKPERVSVAYLALNGDYWVGMPAQAAETRDEIVAGFARRIAEELFLNEAMAAAVFEGDIDGTMTAMSSDARACTVEITGDDDGKIAKRLPHWITVKTEGTEPVAD